LNQYRIQHSGFYVLTLFSLTILLVITGFFLAASYMAHRYTQQFQEEVKLIVELRLGTTEAARKDVIEILSKSEGVVEGSIEFISKEEALTEMQDEMSDDLATGGMENPFSDMLRFALDADHFNTTSIELLKTDVEKNKSVLEMHHPAGIFDPVFDLLKRVQAIGMVVIIIFVLLCAILIHHIMRLNVLSQRKEIRTMQLVGGHPAFIRRPYIVLALKMAVTAWAAAGLICVVTAFFAACLTQSTLSPVYVTIGSGILLLLALAVCMASTWVAVTRVLSQS
jgi:cell division transport system permease protein